MKRIIVAGLAALLLSGAAQAVEALVATNAIGGRIVLTMAQAPFCGSNYIAFASEPLDKDEPGATVYYWGCWALWQGELYVHYFIGRDDHYPAEKFQWQDIGDIFIPGGVEVSTKERGA